MHLGSIHDPRLRLCKHTNLEAFLLILCLWAEVAMLCEKGSFIINFQTELVPSYLNTIGASSGTTFDSCLNLNVHLFANLFKTA